MNRPRPEPGKRSRNTPDTPPPTLPASSPHFLSSTNRSPARRHIVELRSAAILCPPRTAVNEMYLRGQRCRRAGSALAVQGRLAAGLKGPRYIERHSAL